MNAVNESFVMTKHAQVRCLQRGVRTADIEYLLAHGKKIYKQGLVFYVMLDKHIAQRGESVRHLVALVSHDQHVVTVYKEKNALKKIKRATKHDLKKSSWMSPVAAHG
jgi:hypothetical protein